MYRRKTKENHIASSTTKALQAYKKYYIDREYEQVDLFRLLRDQFDISSAIYPGSYIQVSPSFVFPRVVYIDADKKAVKYFQSGALLALIDQRKDYPQEPAVMFHGQDYRELIEGYRGQFDLMISQYAGFISDACKPYLRQGGYLLVNNSHADAGMAAVDRDYRLIAAIHKTGGKYRLSCASLDQYFIPKKDILVTKELLRQRGKGLGYTRTAPLYLFQRLS